MQPRLQPLTGYVADLPVTAPKMFRLQHTLCLHTSLSFAGDYIQGFSHARQALSLRSHIPGLPRDGFLISYFSVNFVSLSVFR